MRSSRIVAGVGRPVIKLIAVFSDKLRKAGSVKFCGKAVRKAHKSRFGFCDKRKRFIGAVYELYYLPCIFCVNRRFCVRHIYSDTMSVRKDTTNSIRVFEYIFSTHKKQSFFSVLGEYVQNTVSVGIRTVLKG